MQRSQRQLQREVDRLRLLTAPLDATLQADYPVRDNLVAMIASGQVGSDGVTIDVDGLRYVWRAGSTVIPDMLGLDPLEPYYVEHWGAKGDGTTFDQGKINTASTALTAMGGGTLHFKAATYLIFGSSLPTSNVVWRGAGRGATILKEANLGNLHVVSYVNVSNATIEHMTIDGNRANQTTTCHGIRGANIDNVLIHCLEVKETAHYGIGFEDGYIRSTKVDDVWLHHLGGDAIDFKNHGNLNRDNQISNITVWQWGLDDAGTTQSCCDTRGPVLIDGLYAFDPGPNDCQGLRFRYGEDTSLHGRGGHRSKVTNVFMDFTGAVGNTVCLVVGSPNVSISNVHVKGGYRGAQINGAKFRGAQITIEDCSEKGFVFDLGGLSAEGDPLDANDATLVSCSVINAGNTCYSIETDNVRLVECAGIDGAQEALVIWATATNTRLVGGDYDSCAIVIADSGNNTLQTDEAIWRGTFPLAAKTLAAGTTALQDLFDVNTIVPPNISFRFECKLEINNLSASVADISFGFDTTSPGVCAITSALYQAVSRKGSATTPAAPDFVRGAITGAQPLVNANASTSFFTKISGVIRVTTGGRIVPQIALGAAAAAATVLNSSHFEWRPIGRNNTDVIGEI